jgi:hypothetical protein
VTSSNGSRCCRRSRRSTPRSTASGRKPPSSS